MIVRAKIHRSSRKPDRPVHPCLAEAGTSPCHAVQFYDNDGCLVTSVAGFLGAGLEAGQPVVVIATEAHRDALRAELQAMGLDVDAAHRCGQLTWFDARATLSAIMTRGQPDAERLRDVFAPVLERRVPGRVHGPVCAYGEMVDVLWEEGNAEGALRLEELWNRIGAECSLSLLCAYRMAHFHREAHCDGFREVCRKHGQVIPTERYMAVDDAARLQKIAMLQQRARALEAEVQQRKELERKLQRSLEEQRRAHDALRQQERRLADAQRLESVGLLAGGIAHDFNNLLASVLGNADLLSARLAAGSEDRALAEEIMLAARRCADLTGQLLAYAGRGQLVRAPVDLATLVHEVAALLRTAIPAGGALSIEVPAHAPPVRGDRAQLTQVVMNLVTNAADAIRAGGGTVALRMAEERLDARAIEALSLEAGVLDGKLVEGAYVRLSVADTGVGMSEEVRARMFEPFFTTKSTGRGLGLAATRGIVHAHGGALTVRSTLGRGTVVELWLPIDQAATGTAPELSHPCEKALARPLPRGSVLVVDDEATVRRILARIFAQQGLTVLEAADGRDALAVVEARAGAVDLVLLDLTMPVLGGAEAQKALATRYPEIPVVLMSGYADEPAGELVGACGEPAAFLRKPFERSAVMRVVEMALGQRKPPAALS